MKRVKNHLYFLGIIYIICTTLTLGANVLFALNIEPASILLLCIVLTVATYLLILILIDNANNKM